MSEHAPPSIVALTQAPPAPITPPPLPPAAAGAQAGIAPASRAPPPAAAAANPSDGVGVPKVSGNEDDEPIPLRLFVGQLPKTLTEDELKAVFEPFGAVHNAEIVRVRASGESRGCGFVVVESKAVADKAIEALNCKKVIMRTPISVVFAEGELEKLEFKLFIGLINRNVNQDMLYDLFSPYGTLLECQLITPREPSTRACAFVRYEKRSEALAALRGTADNNLGLMVQWADPAKHPRRRNMPQPGPEGGSGPFRGRGGGFGFGARGGGRGGFAGRGRGGHPGGPYDYNESYGYGGGGGYGGGSSGYGGGGGYGGSPGGSYGPGGGGGGGYGGGYGGSYGDSGYSAPQRGGYAPHGGGPGYSRGGYTGAPAAASPPSGGYPSSYPPAPAPATATPTVITTATHTAAGTPAAASGAAAAPYGAGAATAAAYAAYTDAYAQYQSYQQPPSAAGYSTSYTPLTTYPAPQQPQHQGYGSNYGGYYGPSAQDLSRLQLGPEGSNIFLMHFPPEWTEDDLLSHFSPFGPIIHVRVNRDRATGQSKCFGFVSFDNPTSGRSAIVAMNGYMINGRRIRVEERKERPEPPRGF